MDSKDKPHTHVGNLILVTVILTEQQVLRFEVPVDDALLMEVLQGVHHTSSVEPSGGLVKHPLQHSTSCHISSTNLTLVSLAWLRFTFNAC